MASESIALRQLGFDNVVDILAVQAVFIQKGGIPQYRQTPERKIYTPDIFELAYLPVMIAESMGCLFIAVGKTWDSSLARR